MRKSVLILSAVALLIPSVSLGQHSSKAAESKPASPKASKQAITISGQVGLDGKTIVSDRDEVWMVSNPEVLKELVGKQVLVKCMMQPDKNAIQVLSLRTGFRSVKYSASHSDSAFRR